MATLSTLTATPDLEKIQAVYTIGQSPEIIQLLSKRNAKNCAAFLTPYIKPTDKMLDVGCGPGFITRDFAKLLSQGSITGLDASKDAIAISLKHTEDAGLKNATFMLGDATRLPFPDNTFDVIYSHQILVHVPNPIDIMREIYRVLKPGGIYGSREADITIAMVQPPNPILLSSYEKYAKTLKLNGSTPDAGTVSINWAVEVGFSKDKIIRTESWLSYDENSDPDILHRPEAEDHRRWLPDSQMGAAMIKHGVATREEMEVFAEEWKKFGESKDSDKVKGLRCGEIVCTK